MAIGVRLFEHIEFVNSEIADLEAARVIQELTPSQQDNLHIHPLSVAKEGKEWDLPFTLTTASYSKILERPVSDRSRQFSKNSRGQVGNLPNRNASGNPRGSSNG
ncbi:hypothetical protein OESDEN_20779 [Oesophagostomum dentatum]|uniref:Uncharacterized protein n=1 Tax=Oesophagostomum dentatum TaxID=61180 RepID=A0A0B1S3S3_OESDE|nr:hypothetical protein OESDEN_20779 [Oesophagostomum dentatum]